MADRFLAGGVNTADSPIGHELIAGNTHLLVDRKITVAQGQVLRRGSVLGASSAGYYSLAQAAATDGSAEPLGVLAHDIDTTAAAADTQIYERGDFNEAALIFGAGLDADAVRAKFRALGIFLIKPYGAA